MKKTIICIISFLILFMVGGCKKNGEVPHIIDNDTEREYSIDENLIFDFPDQYNVVDGRVTFDCKVIAPDVSQVKEYTAMKKELDREYLNNIIESKIVIDTYEEYETYDGDVESMSLECDIFLEIRLSVIVADGICRKKRHLHSPDHTVVNRMTGLNVMISDYDGIISHMLDHTGVNMFRCGIDIIVIISGIISLEAIADIDKDHILRTISHAYTVGIP